MWFWFLVFWNFWTYFRVNTASEPNTFNKIHSLTKQPQELKERGRKLSPKESLHTKLIWRNQISSEGSHFQVQFKILGGGEFLLGIPVERKPPYWRHFARQCFFHTWISPNIQHWKLIFFSYNSNLNVF